MRRAFAVFVALAATASSASGQDFRIEEVASVTALSATQLKPKTIVFNDHRNDELADPGNGLIRFEDWARSRPIQKQFLSLYPTYAEPTINVTVHGVTKPYKEKLHMYVAQARFALAKPSGSIDFAQFATLSFLERIDPTIKHRTIAPADVMPLKDPEVAHNLHPERRWCEDQTSTLCIQSRYRLEGQLPLGVRLANKLSEGKKISDAMEFQSELKLLSPQEIDQAGIARLTGLNAPIAGVLAQSIFYVNQVMQFGRFLAVFQQHPTDPNRTVATVFMALAVETDVLEMKKEYESYPVLRNLVPAQVLLGKSTFNTGTSISAGLPDYTRNRIKAIASIIERE